MSNAKRTGVLTLVLAAIVFLAGSAQAVTRKAPKRHAAGKAAAELTGGSVLVKSGLDAMQRKDYNGAIESFTKAARADGDGSIYFLLGYAHYQRGFASGDSDTADKKDALETVNAYTTALALDPKLEGLSQPYKLYHSLGLSYEALGEYEKAIDAYRRGLVGAPRNPMLPLYAARTRYRMNDLSKSAANLEISLKKARETGQLDSLLKVVETNPQFSVMLKSAEHLAVVRRYDPKATALAALSKDMSSGPIRDAVKGTTPSDNRVAEMRRQDKDVLDQLSAANDEFKFRRYRESINGYNDALKLNERSGILNPTQIAFVYERVGTAYNRLGLNADAIKALRKCVQAAPMDSAAYYQLSLAYAVLGQYKESVHALSETLKSAPSTGELKRYMLLAKTDAELEGVRDLPAFRAALDDNGRRAMALR